MSAIPGAISNALKGIGGEYELNRLVGAFGGVAYVLGANGFVVWNMLNGAEFDVIGYCTAFPGGLAILAGGTAGAVAIKDRNVASAKIIEQTGAVPTPAKDGARVPIGDPPPVDKPAGGTLVTELRDERPDYAR
jgi:hypothetical protein